MLKYKYNNTELFLHYSYIKIYNEKVIYLDNAATSPIHTNALKIMYDVWQKWGNPSSLHKVGKYNKEILENSRSSLKQVFNIKSNAELIFTPSATIANNIVLKNTQLPILTSHFEHPSVYKIPNIQLIDLNKLEYLLKKKKYLISLSLVNNESGMIVANKHIIELIKKYDSKLHIDASQAKEINFQELNCDYLTISSHKIGGPIGIACLVTKTLLPTFISGGGQEFDIISGTPATPLIAGFAQAAKELENSKKIFQDLNKLIIDNINKKYILNNFIETEFVSHIICLLTYDIPGTELFSYMDINNIAISYGSACSSGTLNSLKILSYFDLPSRNGIRISFGAQNNKNEILKFIKLFNDYI